MTTEKLIVNFTPTGMIPTKAMTPHVPVSVAEIVDGVHEAWEIGISIVHLHARDRATGAPTYHKEVYREIIGGIRRFAPELIVCVSLSGRNFQEIEKRSEPLELGGDLKPDMGSLTLSSLNFHRQASSNTPDVVKGLARRMKRRRIAPELEAFDLGMINYARYLARKELIAPPFYFNLFLGNIASAQADLLHAGTMVRDLPEGSIWAMGGVGSCQLETTAIAIATGGGVRVGLEDNIWLDRERTQLASNRELLQRIHTLAELHDRPLFTSAELRPALNLEDGVDGRYGLRREVSTSSA